MDSQKRDKHSLKTRVVVQCDCGGDRNFGYILADTPGGSAFVIDPSPSPWSIMDHLQAGDYLLKGIINTHGHSDHTEGIDILRERYRVPVMGHVSNSRADMPVSDGETCLLGELPLRFLHTPGHTADSICILFGSHLFTGDTLFVGKVGGTSGAEMALAEFESLQRLMDLEEQVLVWPGHNYGVSPHSSIGKEKRENPFILRLNDFAAFVALKENWAEYKRKHGIV